MQPRLVPPMGTVNLGPAVATAGEQEGPTAGVGPDRPCPGREDAVLCLRSTHLIVIGPLISWLEGDDPVTCCQIETDKSRGGKQQTTEKTSPSIRESDVIHGDQGAATAERGPVPGRPGRRRAAMTDPATRPGRRRPPDPIPRSRTQWATRYGRSLIEWMRFRGPISRVERFCFFIGYARSGHTLVARDRAPFSRRCPLIPMDDIAFSDGWTRFFRGLLLAATAFVGLDLATGYGVVALKPAN